MLVSGVLSSWAARLRKRSLRASRSAAASTAPARARSGCTGRRSRTPPSKASDAGGQLSLRFAFEGRVSELRGCARGQERRLDAPLQREGLGDEPEGLQVQRAPDRAREDARAVAQERQDAAGLGSAHGRIAAEKCDRPPRERS